MCVHRHLCHRQRVILLATSLAQNMAALSAGVNRRAPAQIGQPEVDAPIAAIGGADQ